MQAKSISVAESPTARHPGSGDVPARSYRTHSAEAPFQTRRHHRRPARKLSRPTWALVAGALAFLALLAILQFGPGGRGLAELEADHFMGPMLWWPLGLCAFFGLAAAGILVAFRVRNPDGKEDSDLRHHVGRRLVKLNLIGTFFFLGWLGGLFLVTVALMIRG